MTENCGNCRYGTLEEAHTDFIRCDYSLLTCRSGSVSKIYKCGQWKPKTEPTCKSSLQVEKPTREQIYRKALDDIIEYADISRKVIAQRAIQEAEKL